VLRHRRHLANNMLPEAGHMVDLFVSSVSGLAAMRIVFEVE
jgi:hypothetical protein